MTIFIPDFVMMVMYNQLGLCPAFCTTSVQIYSLNSFGLSTRMSIHLSNVLTDHFLNSLPEKTTKGIPMKFSQCPFKNIFHRLPLSNCDIYLQIFHVIQRAIFTFYGTCIACVSNITFQLGYFSVSAILLIRKTEKSARFVTRLCITLF